MHACPFGLPASPKCFGLFILMEKDAIVMDQNHKNPLYFPFADENPQRDNTNQSYLHDIVD